MSFSLLLHFNQIENHAQAVATVWQAWQKHFKMPLLLFRGKGPGQSIGVAQLKKLATFGPKDADLNFKFKESLKRDAARLEVSLARPVEEESEDDEFLDDDDFGDVNYLSAQFSDDWFRATGAAAAEAAVVGFISAVAEIGKLKDAEFEHDDIAYNEPGGDLSRAITREYECLPGHLFFANPKIRDAYSAADWKKAGFQIHAKWKSGWLVGLPLNYEPNTIEAAWRLFDALEKLGVYRRGQIKPNLLKVDSLSLRQAGDYLATYEKKLGKVFGNSYTTGIEANEVSTSFGDQMVSEKPAVKPTKATAKKTVARISKPTRKLKQLAAVPCQSELDEIFGQFSQAFLGKLKGATPIAFAAQLAREELDYSQESLKLVDEYLSHLHKHKKKISDADWESTVLYAGAYMGEVIRRATNGHYRWIDYDEYIPAHPKMQQLIPERNTATCAFLVGAEDSMMMPLNKIARFIDEGSEHSVHYFASVSIQEVKPTARQAKPAKKRSKK